MLFAYCGTIYIFKKAQKTKTGFNSCPTIPLQKKKFKKYKTLKNQRKLTVLLFEKNVKNNENTIKIEKNFLQ